MARIIGQVMYARGGQRQWVRAVEGVRLLAGDRVETRSGMARLVFAGAEVFVNKATALRVLGTLEDKGTGTLIELARGEVYVEEVTSPKSLNAGLGTAGLTVATADGLVSPVGTRFDVHRRLSSTVVSVEEGAVEVRTQARAGESSSGTAIDLGSFTRSGRAAWVGQALRVEKEKQARLRQGTRARVAPLTPEDARRLSWRVRLISVREVQFHFDFEAGKRPKLWDRGKLVSLAGPGGSRFCLAGVHSDTDFNFVRLNPLPWRYAEGLVLSFDYWTGRNTDRMSVIIWDRTQRKNFFFVDRNLRRARWRHVTLRLAGMHHLPGSPERFQAGDVLPNLTIAAPAINPADHAVLYVDNVTIARYRAGAVPATSVR